MIAFDSNVLLRHFLTDPDEPNQSFKVREMVETALTRGIAVYVSQIVLCEVVWVLESSYRFSKKSVIEFLNSVLQNAPFEVEAEEQVFKALREFAQTKAGFADCLIVANAKARGIRKTYTFDRTARNISGMELID